MGILYKQKHKAKDGTVREGRIWWLKFYKDGKCFRMTSSTTVKKDAQKMLDLKCGQVAGGMFMGIDSEKVTFDELCELFLNDYRINGRKSLKKAEHSVRQLKMFFSGCRAVDIVNNPALIDRYIASRKEVQLTNGTINRELAALKRTFGLGVEKKKIIYSPHVPRLEENNSRDGVVFRKQSITLSNLVIDQLKNKIPGIRTGQFAKSIRKVCGDPDIAVHRIPDGHKICHFCKVIFVYEVEDTNPMTVNKIIDYAILNHDLESWGNLVVIPLDRYGNLNSPLDLHGYYDVWRQRISKIEKRVNQTSPRGFTAPGTFENGGGDE